MNSTKAEIWHRGQLIEVTIFYYDDRRIADVFDGDKFITDELGYLAKQVLKIAVFDHETRNIERNKVMG